MTNKIELTEKAIKEIKKQSHTYLRVGVRGSGGCNGFSFLFKYEDIKKDNDLEFEFDGAKVIIDPKSLNVLGDFTLDYHNSLIKSGFKLTSDSTKSSCGCGQSFSIK